MIKSNAKEICNKGGKELQIAEMLLQNGFSKQYYQYKKRMEDKAYNFDMSFLPDPMVKDICESLVDQDIARVSVMFDSKRYVRTTTSIRIKFSDMFLTLNNYFSI